MNAALKKIQARVKKLRKKHPGAKFRTLQKQAGAEYRAGKLKTRKKRVGPKRKVHHKRRVAKVGAVHHKRKKRISRRKPKTVTIIKYRTLGRAKHVKKRRKKYVRAKKIVHCRRVSGIGGMSKKTKNILLIGGAVALGYLLIKGMSPAYTPITLTNPASVSSANSIVAAAQAAGYSATAIASLIKTINGSSDSQVQSAATQVSTGGTLPALYQTALVTPDVTATAPALVAPTLNFN